MDPRNYSDFCALTSSSLKVSFPSVPSTQNHPAESTHQEFSLDQKLSYAGTMIIGKK